MKYLFGSILIAVGILIAGAAGLCAVMIFGSPGMTPNARDLVQIGPWVAAPILTGVGLIIGGVALIRSGRER